jgi:hypothetical protein
LAISEKRLTPYKAQIVEFLQKIGYAVTAPRTMRGLSGEEQTFDLWARRDKEEIVFDIVSEPTDIGAEAVVTFFAKIFDTKPHRAILICIPGLNREAKNLATMYSIQTATGNDVGQVLSKLSELLRVTSSSSSQTTSEEQNPTPTPASTPDETSNAIDLDKVLERARDRRNSPGKSAS